MIREPYSLLHFSNLLKRMRGMAFIRGGIILIILADKIMHPYRKGCC